MPGGIDDAKHPRHIPGFVIKSMTDHRIWIAPRPGTPAGEAVSLRLWTTSRVTGTPYMATVVLEVAEHARDVPDVAEIVHESDVEAAARLEAQRQAEAEQQRTAAITEARTRGWTEGLERGKAESQASAERAMLAAAARDLSSKIDMVPVARQPARIADPDLQVRFLRAKWQSSKYTLVFLEVENAHVSNRPFRPARVQVFAGEHERRAFIVRPEAPQVLYGGERQRVVAAVQLQRGDQLTDLRMALSEGDGDAQPTFPFPTEWRPATDEEIEEKRRQEERERRGKQTSISARVLVGAFWIADGTGQGELGATSMTGLAVRVVKGFTPSLGFEAEILGSRTGEVEFDDVMVETMQGNLRRSATLGRVQLGGVLRFGDPIVPVARVGLGIQGASFAAEMTADGGSPDELDSSFEFNVFLTFGGGVEFRLGNHVLAGITASAEQPLIGAADLFRRSISVGAHLGYGWP